MTRARDPQAGVSLVEVMVVLAIVGIMTGVAVLGFGGVGGGTGAEAEARRLADRLQLAADEALVTGAPRALQWSAAGYRFVVWDEQESGWRPEARPLLSETHELPRGLTLRGPEGEAAVLAAADRAVTPVTLALGGAGGSWTVAFDGLTARAAPEAP